MTGAMSYQDALDYLGHAYGGQKRRLGPLAVLHPIRSAALLAKAQKKVHQYPHLE